jgi:hemerythrin-like metal-binding protein
MSLVWRDQMSVHNTMIDDEHKYLIKQINAVEEAVNSNHNHDQIVEVLDHLVEYTKTHFSHEESIQQKINYPEHENHKRLHRDLITNLDEIRDKLQSALSGSEEDEAGTDSDELTDDELQDILAGDLDDDDSVSAEDLEPLIKLMRSWLVDHIIGNDLKMKPYLSKKPLDFS